MRRSFCHHHRDCCCCWDWCSPVQSDLGLHHNPLLAIFDWAHHQRNFRTNCFGKNCDDDLDTFEAMLSSRLMTTASKMATRMDQETACCPRLNGCFPTDSFQLWYRTTSFPSGYFWPSSAPRLRHWICFPVFSIWCDGFETRFLPSKRKKRFILWHLVVKLPLLLIGCLTQLRDLGDSKEEGFFF